MITIGIPAYNEGLSIGVTLRSVAIAAEHVSYPIQLIIIASGCEDHTVESVRSTDLGRLTPSVLVDPKRRGKATALNQLIQASSGEIVVFCDADVVIGPDSLSVLIGALVDNPALNVVYARPIALHGPQWFWTKLARMNCAALDALRLLPAGAGSWMVCGHLYAVRRSAWKEIPSCIITEDAYVGLQQQDDSRIRYVREALVYVQYPQSLNDYLAQKLRNRVGRAMMNRGIASRSNGTTWIGVQLLRSLGLQAIWYLPAILVDTIVTVMAIMTMRFGKTITPLWEPVPTTKVTSRDRYVSHT